jgi:MYXO-CTERM domain-containing protein
VSLALKPTASTADWVTDSIELSLVAEARGKGVNGTVLKIVVPVTNPHPAAGTQTSTGTSTTSHGTSAASTGTTTTTTKATVTGTTSGTSSTKSTPGWTPMAFLALAGLAAVLRRRA